MITFYQDCIIHQVKKDIYGKNTIVKSEDSKCRVKEKYQLVKNSAAKETVSQFEITLPAATEFNIDDLIEYENKQYAIISFKITRNTIGEIVKKVIYL